MKNFATDYGAVGDGVYDCTPTFNAAVLDMISKGECNLYVPHGQWAFKSPPQAIHNGINIIGENMSRTVFRKQFSGGPFFHWTGADDTLSGGICRCAFWSDVGYSPGVAMLLQGDTQHQPSLFSLEDVSVNGPPGTYWTVGFHANGTDKGLPSQGIREASVRRLLVYNATTASCWLRNVVGLVMDACGFYPGHGPLDTCGLWISGGGTTGTNSTRFQGTNIVIDGQLNITNSSYGSFRGHMRGINTDVSHNWNVTGTCEDNPRNINLVNSWVALV